MQLSPSGTEVAIGHYDKREDDYSTSVVGIGSGEVTTYEGMAVATCGTWSPSGSRLLLRKRHDHLPHILDRITGTSRPIKDVVDDDEGWRVSGPVVAGWLDESRVLISGEFGRRIHLATLDVDTGERIDLLDLPKPSGEYYGIRMAPDLVRANPALVGPL